MRILPAANYYGWSREELKKMKIQEITMLSIDEIQKAMGKVKNQGQAIFELKQKRADGSIRDVEIYTNLVMLSGKEMFPFNNYRRNRKQARQN